MEIKQVGTAVCTVFNVCDPDEVEDFIAARGDLLPTEFASDLQQLSDRLRRGDGSIAALMAFLDKHDPLFVDQPD